MSKRKFVGYRVGRSGVSHLRLIVDPDEADLTIFINKFDDRYDEKAARPFSLGEALRRIATHAKTYSLSYEFYSLIKVFKKKTTKKQKKVKKTYTVEVTQTCTRTYTKDVAAFDPEAARDAAESLADDAADEEFCDFEVTNTTSVITNVLG